CDRLTQRAGTKTVLAKRHRWRRSDLACVLHPARQSASERFGETDAETEDDEMRQTALCEKAIEYHRGTPRNAWSRTSSGRALRQQQAFPSEDGYRRGSRPQSSTLQPAARDSLSRRFQIASPRMEVAIPVGGFSKTA